MIRRPPTPWTVKRPPDGRDHGTEEGHMRTPRPRIGLPLVMVLVAILASAGVVYATTRRRDMTTQTFAVGHFNEINVKTSFEGTRSTSTRGDSDLYVMAKPGSTPRAIPTSTSSRTASRGRLVRLAFPPGPSLVIVKSGALTLYRADDPTCTPRVIGPDPVSWMTGAMSTSCATRGRCARQSSTSRRSCHAARLDGSTSPRLGTAPSSAGTARPWLTPVP